MTNKANRARFVLVLFFSMLAFPSFGAPGLNNLTSWGFLLQNVTVAKIQQSPFDLVVIEPQLESNWQAVFSRKAVSAMKQHPIQGKQRIVLAYLSIGEAEDYRPYWQRSWKTNPPSWLGELNPYWQGNYKVRYWDKAWQKIILKQLQAILDSGFDGIYLDIVDAWYYWSDPEIYQNKLEMQKPGDPAQDQAKAASLMLDWLETLASYTRLTSPKPQPAFLLIPQNGEAMVDLLKNSDRERYWRIVNGIGVESVFFYGEQAEDNPLNIESDRLHLLSHFISRGKTVFSIEYVQDPKLIRQYRQLAAKHHFLPYAAVKMLDRFSTAILDGLH